MPDPISRRSFCSLTAGLALAPVVALGQDKPKPVEAPFERDYPAPGFSPSWKKPQINRTLLADFVIYAHSSIDMAKKLLDKEPLLINGVMDWGAGDWESGLGGASHMGNREMVAFLLERGARMDIFCAAMMGQLEAVKGFLTLEPKLINARGPHGFNLVHHAKAGGKESAKVLEYLEALSESNSA